MSEAKSNEPTKESKPQMLLSFIHSVAVMVDGRVFYTYGVICEEIFGAKTEVSEKADEAKADVKSVWRAWRKASPIRAPLDFPLYVRVLSLGDGKPLSKVYPMIVKYNNVSAIMEL
jgi:hypothetical protein